MAVTHFCWPYQAAGARGKELWLSVASVRKFFDGEVRITIVGDRPPKEIKDVQFISVPRIRSQHHRANRDSFNRLQYAIRTKITDDKFFWMHDDIFLVRTIGAGKLKMPRYYGASHNAESLKSWAPKNEWLSLKKRSMLALIDQGKQLVRDYANHCPQFVDKANFNRMVSDFNMPKEMYLWEVLFCNRYHPNRPGEKLGNFLFRWTKPITEKTLMASLANEKTYVANSGHYAWTKEVENTLFDHMTDSTWQIPIPVIRQYESDLKARELDRKWPCPYRVKQTGNKSSRLCGSKGEKIPTYHCEHYDAEVTIDMHSSGQKEQVCKRCDHFPKRPTPLPRTFNREYLAVTSLRPMEDKFQDRALSSWIQAGLEIAVVQSEKENIDKLSEIYPQVRYFWQVGSQNNARNKHKPRIKAIVDKASQLKRPFLLINSDIEIDVTKFKFPALKDRRVLIGTRRDYEQHPAVSTQQRWGLDAFFLPPCAAVTLPDASFQIGEPWWDYWLAYHFLQHDDYTVEGAPDDWFYHRKHKMRWDRVRHEINRREFMKMYNLDDFNPSKWRRNTLEPVIKISAS